MRSATSLERTSLGILVSGALLAGCSSERPGSAGAIGTGGTGGPGGEVATQPAPTAPTVIGSAPPLQASPAVPESGPVDPAAAKAAWKEGVSLYDSGDYAGAVPSLKLAAAGNTGDPYRRYLLGLALWKSGDLEGAEAALVESGDLDSTRIKTWINLARVRNDLGDRTAALESSDKALGLDPESADALHQKGRALMELNRGEEALDALANASRLAPDNGYIANTLGLLLIQSGRPEEAVEPLELAKGKLPNVAWVRNNLAVAYERSGRLEEARIEYQAAVDAGDTQGKASQSLARVGAPRPSDTTDSTLTAAADPAETE